MGALTASLIAIAGIALGWITIEMACKPCLEKGREAIDRNLNPDYDPDDDDAGATAIRAPLIPNPSDQPSQINPTSSSSAVKSI